jgi:predicted amidohydrolase
MTPSSPTLTVALISDVFYQDDAEQRLQARLDQAKSQGADIAVLPELPLNPWSPATKTPRDDDAESPGGPRATMQANAARAVGIGLVGGAIVRDPVSNVRYNTALIYDAAGAQMASYCKLHIPEEPGFWESSHYEPGLTPPVPIAGFSLPIGVQICSDINRPEGSHLLGAAGAMAILAPRATELATYDRWRVVFQANALTSCAFVLSVNRPEPEQDVLIGGPSIAVAPNGRVMLETTDAVGVVTLDSAKITQARLDYPGYLAMRSDLYAQTWSTITPRHAPNRQA